MGLAPPAAAVATAGAPAGPATHAAERLPVLPLPQQAQPCNELIGEAAAAPPATPGASIAAAAAQPPRQQQTGSAAPTAAPACPEASSGVTEQGPLLRGAALDVPRLYTLLHQQAAAAGVGVPELWRQAQAALLQHALRLLVCQLERMPLPPIDRVMLDGGGSSGLPISSGRFVAEAWADGCNTW